MVESAQETGVDPLMKFSCQKNTQLPQGLSLHHGLASHLQWNWKSYQNICWKERFVYKQDLYCNLCLFSFKSHILPMLTWIFICETNTDFNFGWNYIWQRVAGFGNILPQILEFQSSNGVTKCQDIAVWNYGVVLHFDINITEGGLWNKWCSHIQKEGQFCDFTWLIDFSRQKLSILPDHLWAPNCTSSLAVWPHFCTDWCFVTFSAVCGGCGERLVTNNITLLTFDQTCQALLSAKIKFYSFFFLCFSNWKFCVSILML